MICLLHYKVHIYLRTGLERFKCRRWTAHVAVCFEVGRHDFLALSVTHGGFDKLNGYFFVFLL